MANFDEAYEKTLEAEGHYANNPSDRGGETYRGIARRAHPDWAGWLIIDAAKRQPGFPGSLERSPALQLRVRNLYKAEYWDRIRGDRIESQMIAEELFDTFVNTGIRAQFLQRALNLLNRNQGLYPDIPVDGVPGPGTLAALEACLKSRSPTLIYNVMNILQGARYVEIMERDRSQEEFVGWFNRVEIIKKRDKEAP